MKFRTDACILLTPLLLALAPAAGRGAPFAADLALTSGGQTSNGTFNYQDKSYRFTLPQGSQQLIIQCDGRSGVTRVIAPAEKAYSEAAAGEPMAMFANPFSAYTHLSKTKTVRTDGTEAVAGIACTKRSLLEGEQVWVVGWVAEGYDVPLKVEIPLYGITAELRNIKAGPQDASLFTVPAGYQLKIQQAEEERQPDWVGQVARAPLVNLPVEKTLKEGGIVRVRTRAGRWVNVEGTNVGQGQASFTVLPFKGGKSLGTSEMATTDVDVGNPGAMSIGSQPKNADEIAIRVGAGTLKLKITYVAPQDGR